MISWCAMYSAITNQTQPATNPGHDCPGFVVHFAIFLLFLAYLGTIYGITLTGIEKVCVGAKYNT